MGKITLQGHLLVPADQVEAVSEALVTHKELTLQEPGCIVFKVEQRADDPLIFDVYEEYADQTSFEAHKARIASSTWGEVTKDVERHYEVKTEV